MRPRYSKRRVSSYRNTKFLVAVRYVDDNSNAECMGEAQAVMQTTTKHIRDSILQYSFVLLFLISG
jgi:hypothetical protein